MTGQKPEHRPVGSQPVLLNERQHSLNYLLTFGAIAVNQSCQGLKNFHVCPGAALLKSRNRIRQQEIQVLFINNYLSTEEKNTCDLTSKNVFILSRHVYSSESSCVRQRLCAHLFCVKMISSKGLESSSETETSPYPRASFTSSPLLLHSK